MKAWTRADLAALSAKEFSELWMNARRSAAGTGPFAARAAELVALMAETGRSPTVGEKVRLDDPIGVAIRDLVHSGEGTDLMIRATEAGLPALAGLEPMIRTRLGPLYAAANEATIQAGYLVTGRMEALGYVKSDLSAAMPAGSVAKTAIFFRKKQ